MSTKQVRQDGSFTHLQAKTLNIEGNVSINGQLIAPNSSLTGSGGTNAQFDNISAFEETEITFNDPINVPKITIDDGITQTVIDGGSIVAESLTTSGQIIGDQQTLFLDETANRVGINRTNPTTTLDVNDTIHVQTTSLTGVPVTNDEVTISPTLITITDGTDSATITSTRLYAQNGSSGATISSSSRLVIESNNDASMQILTGSTNIGSLFFGRSGVGLNEVGRISYDHSSDEFQFFVGGLLAFTLDSSGGSSGGNLTIEDSTPTITMVDTDQSTSNVITYDNTGVVSTVNIDPGVTADTSSSIMGLFKNVDVSNGEAHLVLYVGNNTSTVQHQLSSNVDSSLCLNNGDLNICNGLMVTDRSGGDVTFTVRLIQSITGEVSIGDVNTANLSGTVAIGPSAGANAIGTSNILVGNLAGQYTRGTNNIYVGRQSGPQLDPNPNTDTENIAIGTQAGQALTNGDRNTILGYQSGFNLTTGSNNTLLGWGAGLDMTQGSGNTCVGWRAGLNLNTGLNNTFIGRNAGLLHTTGQSNIFIGTDAGSHTDFATVNNKLIIENSASNTPLIYGDFVANTLDINGSLTITQDLTVCTDLLVVDCGANQVNINGDLNIIGNMTHTSSTSYSTTDSLLELNSGAGLDNLDIGLYAHTTASTFCALYRDVSDLYSTGSNYPIWKVMDNITVDPTTGSTITPGSVAPLGCEALLTQVVDTNIAGNLAFKYNGTSVMEMSGVGLDITGNLDVASGFFTTTSVNARVSIISSSVSELVIDGDGTAATNASIRLIANNASTNFRALGTFGYDHTGDTMWFWGRPYSASDSFAICRKSGITNKYDSSTSDFDNALFRVNNAGEVSISGGFSTATHVATDGLYQIDLTPGISNDSLIRLFRTTNVNALGGEAALQIHPADGSFNTQHYLASYAASEICKDNSDLIICNGLLTTNRASSTITVGGTVSAAIVSATTVSPTNLFLGNQFEFTGTNNVSECDSGGYFRFRSGGGGVPLSTNSGIILSQFSAQHWFNTAAYTTNYLTWTHTTENSASPTIDHVSAFNAVEYYTNGSTDTRIYLGERTAFIQLDASDNLVLSSGNAVICSDSLEVQGHVTLTGKIIPTNGVSIGTSAGQRSDGVFVGNLAGQNITSGLSNVCIGVNSGTSLTTGGYNTVVGESALNSVTGSYNTAIGQEAGINATGSSNTFLGRRAGYNNTSGSGNTFIGINSGNHANFASVSNQLVIGDGATPLIHGDFLANTLDFNGYVTIGGPSQQFSNLNMISTDVAIIYFQNSGGSTVRTVSCSNLTNELEVQTSPTSGTAVVKLTQNDTDQAFINFSGTSGAGSGVSISTDATPGTGTTTLWIQVEINGAKYWLQARSDA